MRGLSPNWLLGTETLHLYIRRRTTGNRSLGEGAEGEGTREGTRERTGE